MLSVIILPPWACNIMSFFLGVLIIAFVGAIIAGIVWLVNRFKDFIEDRQFKRLETMSSDEKDDYWKRKSRNKQIRDNIGATIGVIMVLCAFCFMVYGFGSLACDAIFQHTLPHQVAKK